MGLSACGHSQIKGTYINTAESYKELFFEEKSFVFRYNNKGAKNPLYYCSDTISYGYWSRIKDHELLQLTSEELQLGSISNALVSEKSTNSDTKRISFKINSPIEAHQKKINSDVMVVSYGVEIMSNCLELQETLAKQRFFSSEFSVSIPVGCSISSFSIYVYPVDFLLGWQDQKPRVVHSFAHEINDHGANVFEVYFPQLTYCYINSMKLMGDYVLIYDGETLRWNGEYYKLKK